MTRGDCGFAWLAQDIAGDHAGAHEVGRKLRMNWNRPLTNNRKLSVIGNLALTEMKLGENARQ